MSDSYWIRKLIVTALPPLGFRCKHCGEMCTKANGYTCACDDAAIDAKGDAAVTKFRNWLTQHVWGGIDRTNVGPVVGWAVGFGAAILLVFYALYQLGRAKGAG